MSQIRTKDTNAEQLLRQLVAWNRNPNGDGRELGEICATAELLYPAESTNEPRHGQREIDTNRQLRNVAESAISALRDLDAGYPWRELHVDVKTLRSQAEACGVTVED